ncbi:MAG: hypothetical protein VX454_09130 [Pseudomonadota bacterium]|jgi:hypothetical protein|nr:hypothetical protein [Pseudomonadota bacterium]
MILLAKSQTASRAYRVGLGLAALTAFVTVWTTIVRDDGQGAASFMVILAAAVGALAVRMEAAGMARAMAGVAVMQVTLGLLFATAPSTIAQPGGPARALVWGAVLAGSWLASAACFRRASRKR